LPPELAGVAPHLFHLRPGHDYGDIFFRLGWRNAWGILLATTADQPLLYRHLRTLLRARSEKKRLVFRYYDPRILRQYLPACTPAELERFFGPISSLVVEAEEPNQFHLFQRGAAGFEHLRLEKDGEDLYPRLFEAMSRPDVYDSNRVRFELMRRLGYFVTESSEHNAEYSSYFIPHGREHAERFSVPIDEYLRRCDRIIDEFERQGIDPRSTAMRIGIFGAEPWTEGMRREIERRVGIDAVDIYGLSEVMGPGVACEFVEAKDGPTIWEDHFYPEIVDPDTGAPVPDGEPGELVFTSLSKEAMPVIRYRTRDLTRLLPGSATTMRRMAKITGRSDDMLIVRGVNLFPSQVEEQILRDPALTGHYVIELSRTGALDDLLIRVEARAETAHKAQAGSAAKLIERLKGMCGLSAEVQIAAPGAIERSMGKARLVLRHSPVGVYEISIAALALPVAFVKLI